MKFDPIVILKKLPPSIPKKIKLPEHEDSCWEWLGCLVDGYAQAQIGGKQFYVHRYIYQTAIAEEIPTELECDHLCRNRACVNPGHIEVVTRQVNQLRGGGVSGKNARKTHCLRGHILDGDNMYIYSGKRICRICKRSRCQ